MRDGETEQPNSADEAAVIKNRVVHYEKYTGLERKKPDGLTFFSSDPQFSNLENRKAD